MRNRKSKILGGILLAALVLIQTGCQQNNQNEAQLLTLPASTGSITDTVTFIGNVSSSQSSTLNWRTSGVIESVEVKLGDTVSEGQIIATLAKDSIPPSVLRAEIPLLDAQQNLEDLLISETAKAQSYKDLSDKELALQDAEDYAEGLKYPKGTQSDVDYWAEQVEITKGYYDDALKEYDAVGMWQNRNDPFYPVQEKKYSSVLTTLNNYSQAYNNFLYYNNNSTQNEKDQAEANIDVAQTQYEKALIDFRTYAVYPREKDLKRAESEIQTAQDTYNQRSIVADITGEVTVIKAREGDYVQNGTNAFQLDNTQRLFIPINVSEIDIVKIKDGQKVSIVLDANPDVIYQGIVTTVSSSGEEDSSRVTFTTMVEILEPDDKVKLGMTAEVDIILQQRTDALLVAANAIFSENGTSYVTIIKDNVQSKVEVTPGLMTDTIAEINAGDLKAGDEVLVPSVDESILTDLGLDMSYMMQNMSGDMPQPIDIAQK